MKKAVIVAIMAVAIANSGVFAQAPVQKTWADDIKFKGDVRYRHETIDEEGKDKRNRDRLRARLAAEAKVNDSVNAVIGLSSGDADPVSSNQTETDGFTRKDVKIELMYLDWTLIEEQLKTTFGKMKNPFFGPTDLIWDGDLNPEGIAAGYKIGDDSASLVANAGYLYVMERSSAPESMLYAGQIKGTVKMGDNLSFMAGGGYYQYDNMDGQGVFDYAKANNAYGNSTANKVSGSTTNKLYTMDYKPIEYFAELTWYTGIAPISLVAHQVANSEADEFDSGHQYGFVFGKCANPKTYEFGIYQAELEKDAVVGAFTDSDRWGGGADGKGMKYQAKYAISKNYQFNATFFSGEKVISNDSKTKDYDRLQLDLVAKF